MALRMSKSKPKLCLRVCCVYLAFYALLNVACASTNNEFDVCEKALKKTGVTDIERDSFNKSYGFGEYRVAVGNAGNYGLVCLLASSQKTSLLVTCYLGWIRSVSLPSRNVSIFK